MEKASSQLGTHPLPPHAHTERVCCKVTSADRLNSFESGLPSKFLSELFSMYVFLTPRFLLTVHCLSVVSFNRAAAAASVYALPGQLQRQAPPLAPHEARPVERLFQRLHAGERWGGKSRTERPIELNGRIQASDEGLPFGVFCLQCFLLPGEYIARCCCDSSAVSFRVADTLRRVGGSLR